MRYFLVAGEPSGDRLGAALMAGLKQLDPEAAFFGVGGPLMTAEGLTSLFPMQELSVMGIAEILPKYRQLRRRVIETAHAAVASDAAALITIDSPDFCLRVAKRVRAAAPKIRTIHYVAPSVWAWRPGRAVRMARHIDQVLALLPFEPPYMEAAGMRCDFVGHPVVAEKQADAAAIADFRARHGLGDAPFVLVLPGSRRSEIARLAAPFGAALTLALRARPEYRVVVPTLAHLADDLAGLTADWPGRPIILAQGADKAAAFGGAQAALAASGTVSLELAAAHTPMVIAYDLNWLSWQIMRRMARIDTVTLVNLVTGSRAIPEFLGPDCTPAAIATALGQLFDDPAARTVQQAAMADTMRALGQGDAPPGLRAARAVLAGLGQAFA